MSKLKFIKKIIVLCLIVISQLSCHSSYEITKTQEKEMNNDNPFFAYNFGGLEKLPPAQQIKLLKNNGYDGITLRMAKAEHVAAFNDFLEVVNETPDFKIYSVFVRYNFADNDIDKNRWKVVVDLIQNKDIDLWFIFGKHEAGIDDAQVEGVLRDVVGYASPKNVPVTLYPHSWCYFETAEQSLPMVKKINHPNLKLAVHTCHELKAGNGDRLAEVVDNVKDYISFVTVAGASNEVDRTTRKSMDATTIQPLEDGEYDFSPFMKALKGANYKGPVGYINFGFDKAPQDYLSTSLKAWNRLKYGYLNYKQ